MTVVLAPDGTIRLAGVCLIEDAEPLLRLLLENPAATVDWRPCEQAHAAVVQVLLAVRPALLGPPAGRFLREHVGPLVGDPAANASAASDLMRKDNS